MLVAAAGEKKAMQITGDANLCSVKWNEAGFIYQALATELTSSMWDD